MFVKSIPEFGRIPRAELGDRLLHRLQAFDERHSRTVGGCIFDWGHVHYVAARNYVGVVRVAGLTVEILPKVDDARHEDLRPYCEGDQRRQRAQQNLLYMLSLTRRVPIRPRDLAALRLQRMPLLEALIAIFVERLLDELRKGRDHAYVRREENLPYIKGKLLLRQHIRQNAAHGERVFVGYDDFVSDTWLNRILKAACRRLLAVAASPGTQQRLREAILRLADVEDVEIQKHHFCEVHFTRNTERFRTLVAFAQMVLRRMTPTPSRGGDESFSLLFPMETLFEAFIAAFMRRYSRELGLAPESIHAQATGHRRWLLETPARRPRFQLKPDIVVDDGAGGVRLILDTKWKRLKSDVEDSKNGVSQSDLYQLYAYAHRYESPDNVLLFPRVAGVSPKTYLVVGAEKKALRVEFVNLSRDLRRERRAFAQELRRVLTGSYEPETELQASPPR